MQNKIIAFLLVLFVGTFFGQSLAYAQAEATPNAPATTTNHPLNGVNSIPMRMSYNPLVTALPIVYCRINGGELLPFLFDTGYSGTILINEDEAKRLKLQAVASDVVTKDINGVSQTLKQTLVQSVEGLTTQGTYFNTKARKVYIAKIPVNDERLYPEPVVGIVGLDLFWGATLYLDFDQQTLQVIPDDHPDVATAPGAIALPFDYDGQHLRVDVGDVFGVKEDMIVDTGAVKSFFSDAVVRKLKPVGAYDAVTPGAYNSYMPTKMYFLDTVSFKSVTLKNLLVGEARQNKAIIGMDILSRFRLTIDTRRLELVLEPSRALAFRNARALGRSGLEVTRQTDGIVISSAINKYKNLIGSQVVSIDDPLCKGKSMNTLPVARVQALLDGYAGTNATFVVHSQGADKTVTLTRMSVPDMYKIAKEMKR